jgi:hypothetical protein
MHGLVRQIAGDETHAAAYKNDRPKNRMSRKSKKTQRKKNTTAGGKKPAVADGGDLRGAGGAGLRGVRTGDGV